MKKSHINITITILFLAVCGGILVFLLRAPEVTTPEIPRDEIHTKFYEISSKKEAEKYCGECHGENMEAPLPEDHPRKTRCLFCHRKMK